jgi:hypothetical protein
MASAVSGAFGEGEGEEGVGDAVQRRQAARVFAGKGASARPIPGSSRLARTRVLVISPA